jgi:hypothetical protein
VIIQLDLINREEQWAIERLLGRRIHRGKEEFLVRWKGFDSSEDQWKKEEDLFGLEKQIADLRWQTTGEEPARKWQRQSKGS